MKKKFYFLTLTLLPLFSLAQFKFGVQGGFALAKTQTNSSIKFTTQDYRLGPIIGVMAGINLGDSHLSIMQEANYVAKGVRFIGTDQSSSIPTSVKGTHSTHWVELPLNLLYYLPVGNGHFFFGGGPYAGFGLKAKYKITYQVDPSPEVEETIIKFGSDVNDIKRFDYGVHGLIGYKLGYGSYLKAFYSHGLADLSNLPGVKYSNKYFGLSFGYFFNSGR
jgi:hypothetical protein